MEMYFWIFLRKGGAEQTSKQDEKGTFTGLQEETTVEHPKEFTFMQSNTQRVSISNSWCFEVVQTKQSWPGGESPGCSS